MSSLLISDLHLSPCHPETCEAFFNFLRNEAADSTTLYILGDLFEAWIGDDDQDPLSRQVISSLKGLTDNGVAVYLMSGNRDFYTVKSLQHKQVANFCQIGIFYNTQIKEYCCYMVIHFVQQINSIKDLDS